MSRRARTSRDRKQFAERIMAVISEAGFPSPTAFRGYLRAHGRDALSETIRGWLPRRTRAGRQKGKLDWTSVKIPDAQALADFCETTGASAEYVLFGAGKPLRGLTRSRAELAEELVRYVTADYVRRRGGNHPYVDGLAKVLQAETVTLSILDSEHALGVPRVTVEFEPSDPNPRAIVTDKPQLFLTAVCDWVFQVAEDYEREADAREQEQLREVLRQAEANLEYLTTEREFSDQQAFEITQRLLRAAIHPLDPRAKAVAGVEGVSLHNKAQARRQFLGWLDKAVPPVVEAMLELEQKLAAGEAVEPTQRTESEVNPIQVSKGVEVVRRARLRRRAAQDLEDDE